MYPISYEARYELAGRNRLTAFFRIVTAIPGLVVAMLYGLAAMVTAPAAWLAIVFTGRYPKGLYDFNGKVARVSGRVNGYLYLLTDRMPPLNGSPDPEYPIVVDIAPPKAEYSRPKALFRLIVGIPVYILAYVWNIIAQVGALIAWFAVVFTGKLPDGLAKAIASGLRYGTQSTAYLFLLLSEDYPPFSAEDSSKQQAPGQQA